MRWTSISLLLCVLATLGCSGGQQAAQNEPSKDASKPDSKIFKVALLTPGPVSDSGWCALANDGLMAIKSQLGAEVNQQEATGTQIKDAMRSYAQEGYNLIIGHGFEYNHPAYEVGKDFPKTVFVSSSGGETSENVGAFRFYLEQGFYLAGMMAASMSKTGTLAMIGGPDVPSIRSTFKAFRAGALSVNPKINVIETFTGDGADVAKAKQATLAAIGQGADFVIHQANAAAQGVFEACKEKGVLAFGANSDQNNNPTGVVIASAVIVAEPAFVELAKAVKAGTYHGTIQVVGMDTGAIEFVLNPAMQTKVPADVLKKLEETRAKIKDKTLTVPRDEF